MNAKQKILGTIFILLFVIVGFGLPYLIQFKFNFFGATFVTIKDIIGLWVMTPVLTYILVIIIYTQLKK